MAQAVAKQPPMGDLARMHELAELVPHGAARSVRDAVLKEWDADARAHEGLLTRCNQLLAASGVAVSLLVGLVKQAGIDSPIEKTLLVLALIAAAGAALFVLLALRVRSSKTSAKAAVLLGDSIAATSDTRTADMWTHDHDRYIVVHYCQIRMEAAEKHAKRANLLECAQWFYLAFLVFAGGLGIALPL